MIQPLNFLLHSGHVSHRVVLINRYHYCMSMAPPFLPTAMTGCEAQHVATETTKNWPAIPWTHD